MKCKFNAMNTDSIEYTMEITMSLGDWRLIRKGLNENYPQTRLTNEIDSMVWQATKTIIPDDKAKG